MRKLICDLGLSPSPSRSRIEKKTPLLSSVRMPEERFSRTGTEEDNSYFGGMIPVASQGHEEQAGMEVVGSV